LSFKIGQPPSKSVIIMVLRYNCAKFGGLVQLDTIPLKCALKRLH